MAGNSNTHGEPRIALLHWQLDVAWSLLEVHLSDLDDAAYLWEPAPGAWTVRRGPDGRWTADRPMTDLSVHPEPARTIGWLTWRLGSWWAETSVRCFGSGSGGLRCPDGPADDRASDGDWPGDGEATLDWLRSVRAGWCSGLSALDDADLDSTARAEWLQRGTRPFGYVAAWVNTEVTRYAAEIGLLRSLHRAATDPWHRPRTGRRPGPGWHRHTA
ncbi:DinB family protein [Actinopolymorpha singaporensis]|uniref:DinB superfamily protein n=1 Tax=Actinopolymorpha singaporensis TaxID=117157 RepID=A0A1H1L4I1_9ACTN|nr:DinB family protein [Actinopolymorpha singaporensis]SDR69468.1 DinB superfamily protein [Actinopolymorpha singaporensis]